MKINVFCVICTLLLFSCNSEKSSVNKELKIEAGTSKIIGKVSSSRKLNMDSIEVTIGVPYPISGGFSEYKVCVDGEGNFSLDLDVETDISLIGLYTSINPYKSLKLKLINRAETHVHIRYNGNDDFINVDVIPVLNRYDMMQSLDILNKLIGYRYDTNLTPLHLYHKTTNEFLNIVKRNFSERLEIFVNNDNLMSNEFKDLITKDYRLLLYSMHVFGYEAEMRRNYRNVTGDTVNTPKVQIRDRSYFRFLKDFNLNDPQYLQTFTFSEFQDSILQNEVLGLPKIGERDIPTWLTSVKTILADLVGFDAGQYYDILTANAYARQLNEEIRSLSEKQKENITQYWGNGEIAKILFRKNQKVVELEKVKSPTVVNDISSIPKDKVIEAILSKYKNKVVFIDLWATWCGPCLEAINRFKDVKGGFYDKDVVFVYITNGSSPKRHWEEKIKGIGYEHYYLNAEQWAYLMGYFNFDAIPYYVLYNKEGFLVNKFTSFPKNDVVEKMINNLLK